MKATKITGAEIAPLKIASLPSRPTAPTSFGGKGYSASEMKAAFDKLPLFIIDRLNLLLDDITSGDVLGSIPTGSNDTHTVADLIADVKNGQMAAYLDVLGAPLTEVVISLRESLLASEAGDAEIRVLVNDILQDIARLEDSFREAEARLEGDVESTESMLDDTRAEIVEVKADMNSGFEELTAGLTDLRNKIGEIESAFDEIHSYAESLTGEEGTA